MITLIISTCLTAALTDCTESQRLPMPPSTTMLGCNQVASVMMGDEAGRLILPDQFKLVKCKQS